jgi:hypothetical protein
MEEVSCEVDDEACSPCCRVETPIDHVVENNRRMTEVSLKLSPTTNQLLLQNQDAKMGNDKSYFHGRKQ